MDKEIIGKKDLPLFTSAVRVNLSYVYFKEGMQDTKATFEVTIRDSDKRNYYVLGGVHSIIDFLKDMKFTEDHLDYFKKVYGYDDDFMQYLRKFRFRGDIWAMPEGSICFPGEPVMRITGTVIELSLMEQFVINTIMHQTMLASKFARVRTTAMNCTIGMTHVRSHGIESGIKAVRIAKMVGLDSSSMTFHSFKSGDLRQESWAATHFCIQSFDNEIEAFRAFTKYNPERSMILIDTYDFDKGLENFIQVAKETEKTGRKLRAIALDSGDHVEQSIKVRERLNKEGLNYIQIIAAGNYDEYKIKKMINAGAKIDLYIVATEVVNSTDAPKLEVVFKMVELEKNNKIVYKIKLASEKVSYPGKKQVCNFIKDGKIIHRQIVLAEEVSDNQGLLIKIMDEGDLLMKLPSTDQIKQHFLSQIPKFPQEIFNISEKVVFPVKISDNLQALFEQVKIKNQNGESYEK
ncbi:MAG: nicotinate phosphoribosyltransferase [archaeon]